MERMFKTLAVALLLAATTIMPSYADRDDGNRRWQSNGWNNGYNNGYNQQFYGYRRGRFNHYNNGWNNGRDYGYYRYGNNDGWYRY